MKELIKRILPKKVLSWYGHTKKRLRYVPQEERVNFSPQTIFDGHFKVTYRNIPSIRCPFDYVIYQMIISDLKPDLVIEIGTNIGGTTLYLADLMDTIGHGKIHSIDIKKQSAEIVGSHPRVRLFTKGWENYDLNEAAGFSKILIIEDASHMYEDTLDALKKFAPLVSIGSYFIVEDGIINELGKGKGFRGGPLKAIREFLQSNPNFQVDRAYCDMFGKNATFNVNGYLKRIS
jgi:cephalosporin hydroxylase